jgi:salicylate 5-hydroxylase small subunit
MIDSPELRLEIQDLHTAYASCLDDMRLEAWPEFFVEDCRYEVIPRENHEAGLGLATIALESRGMLRDRVYGVRETLFFAPYYQRHILSAARILDIVGDEVRTEANYLVLRVKRDELPEVFNTGRYLDRLVRTERGLRFAERRCVFDSELIANSLIYPI